MKVKQNIISFLLGMAVMLTLGFTSVFEFTLSSDTLYVDGVQVDKSLYKYEGSNYLPLRATAEALGANVEYADGRIDITSKLTDIEAVTAKCKDSCVMIYVYKGGKAVMQGSGFVYNGYIVTAKHVTDAGNSYIVYTDDSVSGIPASLVDVETDLDVAVLSANIAIPSVVLGDSDRLREGQKLVSITSPAGVQNVVDQCIYTGEVYDSKGNYLGVSDTLMTGGSSGGAVFTEQGEIISMSCRGIDGVNNTIPINRIKPILEKLK